MYESDGGPKSEMEREPCKPDYEAMAARIKKELGIFRNLEESLVDFVQSIGRHSIKRDPETIYSLLGKISLDILEKNRAYTELLSQIEKVDGST